MKIVCLFAESARSALHCFACTRYACMEGTSRQRLQSACKPVDLAEEMRRRERIRMLFKTIPCPFSLLFPAMAKSLACQ